LAWCAYCAWSIEGEILRFAQDDNAKRGWCMVIELAVYSI
jgi:hypothetical protein